MILVYALLMIVAAHILTKYFLLSENEWLHKIGLIVMFGIAAKCMLSVHDPLSDINVYLAGILCLIPLIADRLK